MLGINDVIRRFLTEKIRILYTIFGEQHLELNMETNKKVAESFLKMKGNNNSLQLSIDEGDPSIKLDELKIVNTIVKDISYLLHAAARFLDNIQRYWILSLFFISIILVSILLLYCSIRCSCCCKRKRTTKKRKIKKFTTNMVSSLPLLCKNRITEV